MRMHRPKPAGGASQRKTFTVKFRILALSSLVLLAGCTSRGEIADARYGIYAVRSVCPVVGVPAGTGDITLFGPAGSSDSRAIDVTAAITDVRGTCQEGGNDIISTATFTVTALRRDPGPARQVVLPFFDVALRGGSTVAAKQIGQAVVNFPAGDIHGWTRVQATVRVNRAAATLSAEARDALTRRRKAGQEDAAIDPLTDPAIRTAVANATFEHLIGFQLSQDQLRYNVTR